ncbi:FAD-linked oxidase [Erythrobacter sp. HI0019]|nr:MULTISPECIES: FAD-binding oxidoreductase [unclassified Erythrobacter]KZX92662.1 FAD-linked oxidase [Erythrobacter sp. HI0019]KZY09475.1 FAD-linked oxidase [Erythrobacter sp. HI0028]
MSIESKLASLLGERGWVPAAESGPWHRDWLDKFGELPLGVARPSSTSDVAEVVRICSSAGLPVVPQGGNTSLAGAAVLPTEGGVILSLSRMDAVTALDLASGTVTVEAGVILSNLHEQLDGSGFMFPMHLGAEGSAQIGGLIGTNAGGSHAFRYGLMQDQVLGIEVVLPDGTVWNGMRPVQKDNAGYQLRKLFCGAEGTLGIVTRAILKLVPKPIHEVSALLAVLDMAAAIEVAANFRANAGEFLSALEFFSDSGLEMALRNIPSLSYPLQQRASFYMLVEAGSCSSQVPLDAILSNVLENCISAGLVVDGTIAATKAQQASIWRLREEMPEGQRRDGAQLKHDLSVPPQVLAEFLDRASEECRDILDGVRANPFGHLGDGNVHFNLSPPPGQQGFLGLDETFALSLGQLATEMGGSFAAEHGLGRAKVALADRLRDPVERSLMARLKSSFDVSGNLNPGVIIAAQKS